MLTRNLIRVFVLIVISIFQYSCKTEEIIPNGDIKGLVTDAETSDAIQGALVKSIQSGVITDTIRTLIDGSYLLKNMIPGGYEIQASKHSYAMREENVNVVSSQTKQIDFRLNKIPTFSVSATLLDFGLDSTTLKFNISKTGTGTLTYAISKSQNWITVSPSAGDITGETETITVTINKTGLSTRIYKETITVVQIISPDESQNKIIDVYLNGFWIGSKYVNLVRIGTQVWMGENLNVGTRIESVKDPTDNGIIEKYCAIDGEYNCDIYGGLYRWNEMMDYNPPEDTGTITGATQGICPDGWHIPTHIEWLTLKDYLGGWFVAGGKLKEAGLAHWATPNTGATNESGFTGLPGGWRYFENNETGFWMFGIEGVWWCSNYFPGFFNSSIGWRLKSENEGFQYSPFYDDVGGSVRCVKNP